MKHFTDWGRELGTLPTDCPPKWAEHFRVIDFHSLLKIEIEAAAKEGRVLPRSRFSRKPGTFQAYSNKEFENEILIWSKTRHA